MRIIILISFLFISFLSKAQQYTNFQGYGFKANRLWADSVSIQPSDTVKNKVAKSIAILNNKLYVADGTKWIIAGGGAVDTFSLSTRAWRQKGIDSVVGLLNNVTVDSFIYSTRAWRQKGIDSVQANLNSGLSAKLNISDTALMLIPYLRKADTITLSNRIDARVPYTGATTAVDLGTNNITARDVIPTRRLQLGIAASSTGVARFLNDQNSFQSSLISNVPASNINIYLPTKSDTLAVKSDSVTLSNRINLKLNIADTASMLSPYSKLKSVGLTMPSAFNVANSPLTSDGTIAVSGAGTASQYVRGDGQLANFPSNGGGGSSVNYYLNGSVNQGTFGGDTYYELSKIPIIGAGTNFTRTNAQGNGYIASFITDAGDPALLNIPGGNWNLEFYFSASSGGSTPSFYAEIYKVSSSNVFTLIASGSTNPEGITQGTVVDQYFTSITVPQTTILATDRIAIRIFVTTSGRTITLHTEDNNLCEVLTTFSTGLNALNGLTSQVQYFATGTSGTNFNISSSNDTHTFNLPTASATNRGALSTTDWTTFNNKLSLSDTLTISTRAWRQKGIDSVQANLNSGLSAKLNISDTALMLIPYLRKADTITLSNRIDARVPYTGATTAVDLGTNNITARDVIPTRRLQLGVAASSTGTARFLNEQNSFQSSLISNVPASNINIYLPTKSDTLAVKTDVDLKLNISDTSTMLNPYTRGSGTSGQVAYWNATRSLTGSSGFTFTPTSSLLVNNSVTAASAIARGANLTPTLVAAANNDVLVGLDINPTFTTGAFTGVTPLVARFIASRGIMQIESVTNSQNSSVRLSARTSNGTLVPSGFYNIPTGTSSNYFTIAADDLNPQLSVFRNGNVLIQNGGTITDAGFRLDVNGTARVQGTTTITGSTTATGAIARGANLTPTLTAAANNDVLVGLDIAPTFTNGAFTGVSNLTTRINGTARITNGSFNADIKFGGLDATSRAFDIVYPTNGGIRFGVVGGDGPQFQGWGGTESLFAGQMYFDYGSFLRNVPARKAIWRSMTTSSASEVMTLFSTGNVLLQNGGTHTDAGFRLDVNGTARVQSTLDVNTGSGVAATGNNLPVVINSNFYSQGDGFVIASKNSSSATPNLTLRPNSSGANSLKIYNDGNLSYFRQTNVNGVGAASVYLFQIDNRAAKFGVSSDISTTDASFYGKAIWDGGAAAVFRGSSTTQSAAIFRVQNFDATSEFLQVSSIGSIGVNTSSINVSAQLQIESTTRGFLPPRMTTAQRDLIATPAAGLVIFNTTLNQLSYYNGTTWINL